MLFSPYVKIIRKSGQTSFRGLFSYSLEPIAKPIKHTELSQIWLRVQGSLFPWLAEELEALTKKKQQLVQIPFTKVRGKADIKNAFSKPSL